MTAVLLLFVLPAVADTLRFDPPDPDSRTPVVANIHLVDCAHPAVTGVSRSGNTISISLDLVSHGCVIAAMKSFEVPADLGVLPAGIYDVVAKGSLPITVGEGTLTVADAAPPFQVQPNVSLERGDDVRIVGENLVTCSNDPSPVCETAVVKFGDVPATVFRRSPTELFVTAPAHAAGTVDVTVSTPRGISRNPASFHYFKDGETPDPAFFERVLLPVFFSGAGSYGSMWETEAAMHNGNPFQLVEPPSSLFFFDFCFPVCDMRPGPDSFVLMHAVDFSRTGYVLYMPRQAEPNLDFSLVVNDRSRVASDLGTAVPVVREREFLARPFSLLNVPGDTRYRLGLRLYGFDGLSQVRMKVFQFRGATEPLVDDVVDLLPARDHRFAFIGDLLTQYPQLSGNTRMRIEISGATAAARAWGYLSITNNETQHVTVIAPE